MEKYGWGVPVDVLKFAWMWRLQRLQIFSWHINKCSIYSVGLLYDDFVALTDWTFSELVLETFILADQAYKCCSQCYRFPFCYIWSYMWEHPGKLTYLIPCIYEACLALQNLLLPLSLDYTSPIISIWCLWRFLGIGKLNIFIIDKLVQ